jgi:hypothetical protein
MLMAAGIACLLHMVVGRRRDGRKIKRLWDISIAFQ